MNEKSTYISPSILPIPAPHGIGDTGFYQDRVTVPLACARDIAEARHKCRVFTLTMGCSSTQSTLVATVVSELARNIVLYAGQGQIEITLAENEDAFILRIIAEDNGPGIVNIRKALMNGYSSSGGLGLGLSGVKRIVDTFAISSTPGHRTMVDVSMWFAHK